MTDPGWAGQGFTRPACMRTGGDVKQGIPLTFVAVVETMSTEECEEAMREDPWYSSDQMVVVYLGDQEVARITGQELVIHGCDVAADETVARWLAAKLK